MIQKNVLLSRLTTFKIGGNAKFFSHITTKSELVDVLGFAQKNKLKLFVLGGGSNILVGDSGFDGLVLHVNNSRLEVKDANVTAGAGVVWDDLVKKAISAGLSGVECLSGIPGSVGGAPVQNIGAYGQEIKDTFVKLTAFDIKTKKFVEFGNKECKFGYRDSIFKTEKYENRYIIWEVSLKLRNTAPEAPKYKSLIEFLEKEKIEKPTLQQIRKAVLILRKQNHIDPKIAGNAGSFFKNPIILASKLKNLLREYPDMPNFPLENGKIKLFAGWLIDKAGWRGKKYKNVMVSPKHALIIINPRNKGKAKEVSKLSELISEDVERKFGVRLEREVNFVNV